MKRVIGIGGVFFKSQNPALLREWYQRHLGLNIDEYGTMFVWQTPDPQQVGSTQWCPFPADTKYFGAANQSFMLNFRVADLEALLEVLKSEGILPTEEMQVFEYGKFSWILDLEGNKIELWEPIGSAFDQIYESTAKTY